MSVATTVSIRDAATRRLERIARMYQRLEQAADRANSSTESLGRDAVGSYDRMSGSVRQVADDMGALHNQQNSVVAGAGALYRAWGGIGGLIRTAGAAFGALQMVKLSDTIAGTTARLELIVDDGGSVTDFERKIMASANRSRAQYTDVAASIAKLGMTAGDSFTSTDEIIIFTELMNKNFVIGGASQMEQASAMYQLTQAMASGRLQGDEYRSIIENAPLLANAIEDYMRNVVGAEGSMKDWSAQGILTADVVKMALFRTADEVEARFGGMPMTWGAVWNVATNMAITALRPLLSAINWVANNIEIIGPLLLGLGAAFGVFLLAANWTKIASIAMLTYNGVVGFLSIGFGILRGSSAAASAAVFTFNSTLLASPITWVIMCIMALVGILYAGVAAFNKLTDSSVSATGIIGGAFAVLWAFIYNNFLAPLHNGLAILSDFLGNIFQDPVAAVQILFYDMFLGVMGYAITLANGIEALLNSIPGISVDITSKLDSFYKGLEEAQQAVRDESGLIDSIEKWEYMDYREAANNGYDVGKGFETSVADFFMVGSGEEGINLDDTTAGISEIARNTGEMAQSVNIAEEDLRFMRDVAEMRYVQNFVTLTPTVAMHANISEKVDVKYVISEIERQLEEEFVASAEGVYI